MNKLVGPAVIVGLGLIGGAALSQQAPPPASGFQAKPYFQMPLEKDPSRVVRLHLWSFLPAQAISFIATPATNGGPSKRAKSPTRPRVRNRVL